MEYDKLHYPTSKIPYSSEFYVLDYIRLDVNGDNVADDVYLIGKRKGSFRDNFAYDIRLIVYDGKTNLYSADKLRVNYGYNSKIELQQTAPNTANIIICIDSKDVKGIPLHYIYTFVNNRLVNVYDFERNNNFRESNGNNLTHANEVKTTSSLDLSDVKPLYSETERDLKLEEVIRKEYDIDKEGIRYYYNKVDLNGDGVPEIFVHLIGNTVCCKITGACQAAILKVEDGEYNLLSKMILVHKPFIITEDTTNGYRDIIASVKDGSTGDFFVRIKYDGTTYPSIPYLQPRVLEGTKVQGISVVSDDESENPGITLV